MKKVSIVMAIIVISIFGVLINSTSLVVPSLQATTDDGNNEQASDDGNNVIPFEGDLLPQQSPSNEKVILFEETQPETIVQSDNLQNPSIQNQVNQTPTLSQEGVQLQGKEKYDWELPNRKGCKWNDPLPEWPLLWICTDLETSLAWDKYIQNNEEDKPRHLIQDSSSAP